MQCSGLAASRVLFVVLCITNMVLAIFLLADRLVMYDVVVQANFNGEPQSIAFARHAHSYEDATCHGCTTIAGVDTYNRFASTKATGGTATFTHAFVVDCDEGSGIANYAPPTNVGTCVGTACKACYQFSNATACTAAWMPCAWDATTAACLSDGHDDSDFYCETMPAYHDWYAGLLLTFSVLLLGISFSKLMHEDTMAPPELEPMTWANLYANASALAMMAFYVTVQLVHVAAIVIGSFYLHYLHETIYASSTTDQFMQDVRSFGVDSKMTIDEDNTSAGFTCFVLSYVCLLVITMIEVIQLPFKGTGVFKAPAALYAKMGL